MSVWQGLGVSIIIFLAGLQAIPAEYHDAASVDGAGRWARFRSITLPLLTPSIFFTGILSLIGAMQVFDQVYVLARPGKPTEATITLVYFIYEEGFSFFRMGRARAPRRGSCSHRGGPDHPSTSGSSGAGCTTSERASRARSHGAGRGAARLVAASALGRRLRTLGLYAVLIAGGLVMMVPFIWMFATSLKTRAEVFGAPDAGVPERAALRELRTHVERASGRHVRRLLPQLAEDRARSARSGALISCSLAAFAFAVLPFRGRGLLFALIMATLIIPFQVVLVPNFILYRHAAPSVQRQRQLDRHPGAAVGRRVPGRGLRDLPASASSS